MINYKEYNNTNDNCYSNLQCIKMLTKYYILYLRTRGIPDIRIMLYQAYFTIEEELLDLNNFL
jgi:hypothetical protein